MAPWFGPKSRYDGGIASWQGLVIGLLFLPAFFYVVNVFQPADYGWPAWSKHAIGLGMVAGLLLLVWAKYDRGDSED